MTSARRYLSVPEAAATANVAPRMIRRLVQERRLRHYKVGKFVRIDEADLLAFIEAGRQDAVR